MTGMVDALISCLSRKESLLESLVQLIECDRSRISGLDVTGMDESLESEQVLIGMINDNSDECRRILKQVARKMNLDSAACLSIIIAAAPGPQQKILYGMQARLLNLAETVDRINGSNRDLLYCSLRSINRSLEYYNAVFGSGSTYSVAGHMISNPGGGLLVHGEI
jgi:hypothetical protein